MDSEFPLIGVLLSGGFGCLSILFISLGLYQWPKVEWTAVTFGTAAFLCTVGSIITLYETVAFGSSSAQPSAINLSFHPGYFAFALMIMGAILWLFGLLVWLFAGGHVNSRRLMILLDSARASNTRRRGVMPWDRSSWDDEL